MKKSITKTRTVAPISRNELLLGAIPIATLYLLQMLTSVGLMLSGLFGVALYLAFIIYAIPLFWKRPLSIISLLIIGGGFALLLAVITNVTYYALAPIESSVAYVALISLSGLDAPSLLVPASIVLFRVTKNIMQWVRIRSNKAELDA